MGKHRPKRSTCYARRAAISALLTAGVALPNKCPTNLELASRFADLLGLPKPTTRREATDWLLARHDKNPREVPRSESRIGTPGLVRQKRVAPRKGFYESREWLTLRYFALKRHGRVCALCRTTTGEMHVDHIKPRSLYRELELDPNNLQVLCKACNLGKSNLDDTDFRA